MLAFHIGGEDAEYIRVENLRDNGDGWFSADVRLSVGGFAGSYPADFNSWAFSDFQAQLDKLYRTVSGSACFTSYESQLELELTCDRLGHVLLRGEATDEAGTGNTLRFRLDLDQSDMPAIISSLGAALSRYSPRGV
ncbi:hypothetical protein [Pseudohongiella sp. O18]|uniref:WapI family immunity protein n=1 Tax=Pseudohongiella sp. O18 TaxID=2904248 RepID=UPI001F1E90A6|nr:hypothetical protein [Pseudohongiella sp. O18]